MVEVDVCCPQCKHEFEIDDLTCRSLSDAVIDAVNEALDEERSEASIVSFEPEVIDIDGCIMLGELACAIRCGETAEAELLLDRIAQTLGGAAEHHVSIGRYRKNPLLAA